jgi:hypothetical protein
MKGHAVAWWLRHYATRQKVAGLRPNEVNEFFNLPLPSSFSRPWVYISQPYRLLRSVTGITVLLFLSLHGKSDVLGHFVAMYCVQFIYSRLYLLCVMVFLWRHCCTMGPYTCTLCMCGLGSSEAASLSAIPLASYIKNIQIYPNSVLHSMCTVVYIL